MRLSAFFALAAATGPCAAATCESLATLALPHGAVTSATHQAAGPFTAPGGSQLRIAVDFCRVQMTLRPSGDSDILAEVWLPTANWNGKFQGLGNGGFAGSIGYDVVAAAVSKGYAAAATDTGHRGGTTDASWALGHPEKTADFGYRAIHETAIAAKLAIRAFFGEAPKRSYFNWCSNGGRQALMEAQRYPEDYDGIVAGAPAYAWTRLLSTAVFDAQAIAGSESYIPASKLPAIQAAALAACDAKDGVKDGVIEDPPSCRFDPGVLLCKGEETTACLTAPQVSALRKVYGGPGAAIMPGYSPGGEGDAGWNTWITGLTPGRSTQLAFGENFFKYMVYSDAGWDYKTSSLERNLRTADEKTGAALNATDPDLSRFRERSGKLILYHGWSDPAIPPQATVDYYQTVVKTMGADKAGGFIRLFMAPGVGHCSGGPGPNVFGQFGAPASDAGHDVDAAVERWVEQGIAPERIVATKFKGGARGGGSAERTRPLCAYPATAHWTGKGSTDDAANFVCK